MELCRFSYNRELFDGGKCSAQLRNLRDFVLVRTQILRKNNISYTLIRTHTCAYQRLRNISFSENFA